jgi:hypothetical protein
MTPISHNYFLTNIDVSLTPHLKAMNVQEHHGLTVGRRMMVLAKNWLSKSKPRDKQLLCDSRQRPGVNIHHKSRPHSLPLLFPVLLHSFNILSYHTTNRSTDFEKGVYFLHVHTSNTFSKHPLRSCNYNRFKNGLPHCHKKVCVC